MKKILLLPLVSALSIFSACNKQVDQAEIDRQVQQRLDAEHQAQQREELARREGELNAREQALAQQQNTPNESRERETQTTHTQDRQVQDRQSMRGGGDYGLFYSKLEPHGDWIETSDYGYVFHPREAERSTWRPYANGHWVYSDAGWTWVSEEPFGWATYHYGRWTRLRGIGWVWIPGDEWAPAWVSWRKSDSYVGWAPLPPEARFERGTGIHNWADSYYDIGPENYCFIQTREFGAPQVERAIVPTQQNVTIVNETTNVTNITYNNTTVVNQGPSYDEIRVRSAQPVQRVRLERDVNININVGEPRAVVRADALVVPAPVIARATVVEKPKVVKKTVTNVIVERGWDGIQNRQAADQARAKIRSEATPPPNAPPKTLVRPAQASTQTNAPAERSTSSASVAPSPNESASAAQSKSTPFQVASPSPSAIATARPVFTPRANRMPSASPSPAASATATASASPETTPSPRATFAPRMTPQPSASASASPAASATSSASLGENSPAASTFEQRRNAIRDMRNNGRPAADAGRRRGFEPNAQSPTASPAASASPQASASLPTNAPREPRRQDRQERMRERRENAPGLTSPSPSVTPTATP